MQHADHRQPVHGGETAEEAHDLLGSFRIKAGDGFVGKQRAGALGESAGDGDALSLSA